MLNPAPVTDAIASTLLAIADLNAAMDGRIAAFHYRLGQEYRLAERIYKMAAPSMLVAWDGTLAATSMARPSGSTASMCISGWGTRLA